MAKYNEKITLQKNNKNQRKNRWFLLVRFTNETTYENHRGEW